MRNSCLRGDADLLFCGEQERLLRGEERSEGVPPRRKLPGAASMGDAGSVLGTCVRGQCSSLLFLVGLGGLKRGNGSKEAGEAGIPVSAKPCAKASRRLSGEGSTWRMVERVLYAVLGRSGGVGAVRGRTCVACMLFGSPIDSAAFLGFVGVAGSAGSRSGVRSGVSSGVGGAVA